MTTRQENRKHFQASGYNASALDEMVKTLEMTPVRGLYQKLRRAGIPGQFNVHLGDRRSKVEIDRIGTGSYFVYVYNEEDLALIYRKMRKVAKVLEARAEMRKPFRPVLPQEMYDKIQKTIFDFYAAIKELKTTRGFGNVGVIMEGPPGVGKTETIRWIRQYVWDHYRREHYQFSWGELQEYLKEGKPLNGDSLVIMDDVDVNILRDRKITNNPATSQLLTCIDGMHKREGRVMLLSTNEEVGNIDPALLRAGRFDHIWTFDFPTTELRQQFLDERGFDMNVELFNDWSFARIDLFFNKWRVANHMHGTSQAVYYEEFIHEMGDHDPTFEKCQAVELGEEFDL